jgi:multidrug efflux pump subunit AcrB
MERGITYRALKHRKFTIFLIVATLIAGLYSYWFLPRQESPDLNAPGAIIFVAYPGASPEEIEDYVVETIEEELAEIKGFDYAQTFIKSNMASIMVMLKDGVDVEASWKELDDIIEDLKPMMPPGVTQIITNTEIMETPGMIIGITGEAYTHEELADYADVFKKNLAKINGVTRFDIYGDLKREIEIEVDHALLNQHNISMNDVVNMIKAENVTMPTGSIDNGVSKIEVSLDVEFQHIEDIRNINLMAFPDGRSIRLGDIADVQYKTDPNNPRFEINGEKAVYLAGFFEDSLNIVMVGDDVETEIEALSGQLPKDIELSYMVYQPDDVRKSINDFMINLLEAIVFVIIVVFIGMGWRNAVVVSTVIPLSIGLTMIVMYAMGVKLEQMSISGLIISLGMLVDNAIVVSDSIQYHIDQGLENLKAAVVGTREVDFSILSSTLTTIFAFMPLLLLDSTVGKFVHGVPFVVTTALIASYICAIITTPVIAAITFRKTEDTKKRNNTKIRELFNKLLAGSLKRKKLTVSLALAFVIICGYSVTGMEAILLPKADKAIIQIDLTSEFSSDIDKAGVLADQAVELLKDVPELGEYYVSVGSNLPKFYLSVMYRGASPDIAQIAYEFDLSDSDQFENKEELQMYVQSKLGRELIGGTASTLLLELGNFSRPIEIKIMGEDLDRLDEIRYSLVSKMQSMDSVLNVGDDFSSKEYQFYVEIDEAKTGYYGFTKLDIQKEASAALLGMNISTLNINGNETEIIIKSDITTLEEFENLGIKSSKTGMSARLKELGEVKMISDFPVINHYAGERSVIITSDVGAGYSTKSVEEELKEYIDARDYDDVKFEFGGMIKRVRESVVDLVKLGIFSLLMIFSVLILQFDSFKQPFIILATIPIAMASALMGLFITKQTLTFVAMMSLIALMGIVVNNAIVLLDAINTLRREGMEIDEACQAAVNRRYRPITISTMTTVIGLVPLLISGGELFRPLAIALMTGLGFSTVLTMVVVPTIYSLMMTDRKPGRKGKGLKLPFVKSRNDDAGDSGFGRSEVVGRDETN